MKTLSIVMPAYNEEKNIPLMYEALNNVLSQALSHYQAELIFTDDGSQDGTAEVLRALASSDARVKFIRLSRNFGHQAALSAGLENATGDAVITMDCDLQHPPEMLPKLVEAWKKGYQVVYARRRERTDTWFKKWSSGAYYRMMENTSEVHLPRQVGDFRLIDRMVCDELIRLGEQARYLRGLVAWLGFDHTFVDYDQPDRLIGSTRYTLPKMLRLAMDGFLSFSLLPLRAGLWLGVLSVLMSAGFFIFIIYQHFIAGVYYQLYKWLIVLLLGFVGLQFIFLWIVGEYIGRIYGDVRKRPLYVIREKHNLES